MHVGSLVAASTIVLLQVGERGLAFVSSIGGKRRSERNFKFDGFTMSTRGGNACEVIVVGSCNMDLMTYTARLPSRGETIKGRTFETLHGGKGANQAVMAARIGARTAMVGCLGEDLNGDSYIRSLSSDGIDCVNVRRDARAPTGVAQICVEDAAEDGADGGGGNFIVIVPGANDLLLPEHVAEATDRLKGAKVVLCQLEVREEATLKALELGRAVGMTTIFNPAPARADLPDRLLELSDVVCPNETELALLCKGEINPENDESIKAGARELIARGAKNVVVTLGSRGCMLVSSTQIYPEGGVHCRARDEVLATDTVGAGDAFLGSLGAYLARGLPLAEAVGKAVRVASITVTRAGAQPSYPRESNLPPELQLPLRR